MFPAPSWHVPLTSCRYTDDMALNNLQHWMDFCLDKEDAMKHCRAFLSVYVEQSYVERPCLEAEEWRSVRTLNSAVCIRDIWIALLRRADEHVLQAKRSECGEGIWRACLSSRSPEYRNSPGATMVKVRNSPPPPAPKEKRTILMKGHSGYRCIVRRKAYRQPKAS